MNDQISISPILKDAIQKAAQSSLDQLSIETVGCLNDQLSKMAIELNSGKSVLFNPKTASSDEYRVIQKYTSLFPASAKQSTLDGDSVRTKIEISIPEGINLSDNIIVSLQKSFENMQSLLFNK